MSATMPAFVGPTGALIDAGVLYYGSVPTGFGATKGGLTFDPGKKVRFIEFDGRRSPMAGMARITEYDAHFRGKLIEGQIASLMRYEPGSTSDGSSGTNKVTPMPAGPMYATNDFLTDVRLIVRNQATGKVTRYTFAYALVIKYQLVTQDNDEGQFDIDIQAVQAPGETDLTKCPYTAEELS